MKRIFIISMTLLSLSVSSLVFAADDDVSGKATGKPEPYVPMVGVPGLTQANNYTAEMYIDALYKLAITVGGILAVIQIIFGGVQYMFDGSITRKEDGKDRIKGALFGLLIILGAVLLLQTINPDLLNLKIFNNAPSIAQTQNPPVDTRTECQKDANSRECCTERGGNFIKRAAKADPICSMGSEVVLPVAAGETSEQKRTFCLSTPGMEWDGNTCRRTSGKEVQFPSGYTDDDGKDDTDRANYCREAFRGDYNPDKDTCTVN